MLLQKNEQVSNRTNENTNTEEKTENSTDDKGEKLRTKRSSDVSEDLFSKAEMAGNENRFRVKRGDPHKTVTSSS